MSFTVRLMREPSGGGLTFEDLDVLEEIEIRRTMRNRTPGIIDADDIEIVCHDPDRTVFDLITSDESGWAADSYWELRITEIPSTIRVRDWPVRKARCTHNTVSGITAMVAYDPLTLMRDLKASDVWTAARSTTLYDWGDLTGDRWYLKDFIEEALTTIGITSVVYDWEFGAALDHPLENYIRNAGGWDAYTFPDPYDAFAIRVERDDENSDYDPMTVSGYCWDTIEHFLLLLGLIMRWDDSGTVLISSLDRLPFASLGTLTLTSEDVLKQQTLERVGDALGDWRGVYAHHVRASTDYEDSAGDVTDTDIQEGTSRDIHIVDSPSFRSISYLLDRLINNFDFSSWRCPDDELNENCVDRWYAHLHARTGLKFSIADGNGLIIGQTVNIAGSDAEADDTEWADTGFIGDLRQRLFAGTADIVAVL